MRKCLALVLSFISTSLLFFAAQAQTVTTPVSGLKANVTVRRDVRDIPYIEAATDPDLYFVQGYVTASDRLWQMDLMRRLARGETAEIFGTSVVEEVDPLTGEHAPLITGLKTAIDVLTMTTPAGTDYLVLQNASVGPFFGGPGLLLRFRASGGPPEVLADCLDRPTSMTLDDKAGVVYATELVTGRVAAISLGL